MQSVHPDRFCVCATQKNVIISEEEASHRIGLLIIAEYKKRFKKRGNVRCESVNTMGASKGNDAGEGCRKLRLVRKEGWRWMEGEREG